MSNAMSSCDEASPPRCFSQLMGEIKYDVMIREGDAKAIFPRPKRPGGSLSTPFARDACATLEHSELFVRFLRFNKVKLSYNLNQ